MLALKTHLCLLPGSWLLERALYQRQEVATPARPLLLYRRDPILTLPSTQVGLALQPHLVKRSQGLGPRPSSGADQWQSILRTLLVRQVKLPGPGPGDSDHWEPTGAASGQGWGRGRTWKLTP